MKKKGIAWNVFDQENEGFFSVTITNIYGKLKSNAGNFLDSTGINLIMY
jgi:hypothetical protein